MPNFGRYVLWQLPGWVVAGVIIFVVSEAIGVPAWLGGVALALFVGKDLVLYPAMRVVFRPASDHLVGATGQAVEMLAPTGYVLVRGERWRATVRDGRPVLPGTAISVVSAHGLTLLVETAEEDRRAASMS